MQEMEEDISNGIDVRPVKKAALHLLRLELVLEWIWMAC